MIATKIQKLKTIPRLTSFRTFLLPRRSLSSHNLPTGKSWTRNHPWSDSFRSPPKRDFSSRLNKLFIFTARLRTAKKLPCGQKIELLASTSSAAAKPSRSITRWGRVSPSRKLNQEPTEQNHGRTLFPVSGFNKIRLDWVVATEQIPHSARMLWPPSTKQGLMLRSSFKVSSRSLLTAFHFAIFYQPSS